MVKIHGNWCGPNWTDGKNISAQDYRRAGGNFRGKCIDEIDCACRQHDKDCSGTRGCTRSGDSKLVAACDKFLANPFNLILNPVLYTKARIIREGILAASFTRRS